MPTTQRVLHTDSDNHKVVLHSEIVNKRLIRQFVTYDRYPDVKYEYLTSFHAACLILLGVELERCYIPEISVRMFEKAHAALSDNNRRLRIMRYLRTRHPKLFRQFALQYRQRVGAVADAFSPQGRVEIEIGGGRQIREGPVLNRSIVCPCCLMGAIGLKGLAINGRVDFGSETTHNHKRGTRVLGYVSFRKVVFNGNVSFRGVEFGGRTEFLRAVFGSEAEFRGVTFSGDVFFARATFCGGADFWEAKFGGKADFGSAKFSSDAGFQGAAFNGKAWFAGTRFGGEADFGFVTFSGKANFFSAGFDDAALFGETTFSGDADFGGATFSDYAQFRETTFKAHARFESAGFSDRAGFAEFRRAVFCGDAEFSWAKFRSDADFWEATFSGKADFHNARFADETNFDGATFSGAADFWGATFKGITLFDEAIFNAADFSSTRFDKICSMSPIAARSLVLDDAVLSENLSISTHQDLQKEIEAIKEEAEEEDEKEKRRLEKRLKLLEKIEDEHKRELGTVNFEDTLVQGELRCDFRYLVPRKGKPVIKSHRIALGIDKPEDEDRKPQDYWGKAQKQYAWLKEQYRKQGRYEDEDNAHWWASECARRATNPVAGGSWLWRICAFVCICVFAVAKAMSREVKVEILRRHIGFLRRRFLVQPWHKSWWAGVAEAAVVLFFIVAVGTGHLHNAAAPLITAALASFLLVFPRVGKWLLYRKVFGYGVKPQNVLITGLIIIFAFAAIYCFFGYYNLDFNCDPPTDSEFVNALYFSVITYATVGYGDVSPQGWLVGLAMVEGLLGVVLNAALIVVIFRKLIR